MIPLFRGGRHSIGNILPACQPCNSSKHTRLLVEWIPPNGDTIMRIKYVGDHGPVYIAVLGEDVLFEKGKAVEVPDDIAGRSPDPRLRVAMLEHREAILNHQHELARTLNEEITSLDPGEGLLAQDETWAQVGKPKVSDEPKDGGQ